MTQTHTHRQIQRHARTHTPTHTHLLSIRLWHTVTHARAHTHTHSPTVSQAVTQSRTAHTLTYCLRLWHIHTYLAASAAVCPSPNSIFIWSFTNGCKVLLWSWWGEFVEVDVSYGYVFMTVKEKVRLVRSLLSHSEHTLFALWVTSSFCVCPSRWLVCVHWACTWSGSVSALCLWHSGDIFQFIIRF